MKFPYHHPLHLLQFIYKFPKELAFFLYYEKPSVVLLTKSKKDEGSLIIKDIYSVISYLLFIAVNKINWLSLALLKRTNWIQNHQSQNQQIHINLTKTGNSNCIHMKNNCLFFLLVNFCSLCFHPAISLVIQDSFKNLKTKNLDVFVFFP